MKRVIALALSLVTGAGLAMSMQAPASAGDVPPIVGRSGTGTSVQKGIRVIAQIPGTGTSVQVSAKNGVSAAASSSTDGRVVAYISIPHHGKGKGWVLVIRKDGVLLRHVRIEASGVLPSVTSDGSRVVVLGPQGLRVFDVQRQRWSAVCAACPATGITSASMSPDHLKVALAIHQGDLEIYRISDGHRLARTPLQATFGNPAWNATSDTVAISGTVSGGDFFGINTLSTSGVAVETRFKTAIRTGANFQNYYLSPCWMNNAVWAIKLDSVDNKSMSVSVVTAKAWNSAPQTFGAPLYTGKQFWRTEVVGLVGWSAALPTPAH